MDFPVDTAGSGAQRIHELGNIHGPCTRRPVSPLPVQSPQKIPPFDNRLLLIPALLVLSLALAGCLIYQTIDYRLQLNPDGKSGSFSIECANIESSATESAKQEEDFRELINNWKDDRYLLERMEEGLYIKQRGLTLRKGVLIWKESGIFSDVRKLKDGVKFDDTTSITLGKDQTVVATNGTAIITRDSTLVLWPPHTRDFRIKIEQRNFEPTSHFAERFRALKRK